MPRLYFVNGESMVTVRGPTSSLLSQVVFLGLSEDAINITADFIHDDIGVDAYGNTGRPNPPDMQVFGATAQITMNLVHYDPIILQECIRLSMGGNAPGAGGVPITSAEGQLSRAGTLMGGNSALLSSTNNWIVLNILSPVGGIPWRFFAATMTGPPYRYPLGTKRSIVACTWRAIAYSVDPWNNGLGSAAVPLYDHLIQV